MSKSKQFTNRIKPLPLVFRCAKMTDQKVAAIRFCSVPQILHVPW